MRAGSSREEAACPDQLTCFARPALLALSALLLCRGIAAPFNGWHDLNSAMYAQFARNHVQYGLRYTALYCTWGDSAAAPEAAERYLR